MRSTPDDSVDGAVLSGTTDVFALCLPVIVGEEVLIGDGIHVDVLQGLNGGMGEVGFMPFGGGGEGAE